MLKKQIYIFIGTTAELIKLAPVIREFKRRKIGFKLITTGQTKILFEELTKYLGPVKVHITFKEKGEKSSIFYFILWSIRTFFAALFSLRKEFNRLNKNNSYFIVHGDTVSSLLGALVASIYRLKLVHIESGLRSFNFFEPFPEELSRYIISHLADIHFCPNQWSMSHLKNFKGIKINTKQNTLLESFRMAIKTKKRQDFSKKLKKKYFVLIVHRQEHVIFGKQKIKKIVEFVLKEATKNLTCVFIIHDISLNLFKSIRLGTNEQVKKRVITLPRLPYVDFIKLVNNAEFIVTDGGSNQEEAYYLGKPCLLLRNHTERIEGLGENVVLAKSQENIMRNFFNHYKKYKKNSVQLEEPPASKIIISYLIRH